MDKISMPWYPKDWWTSDTFFLLTPLQRYLYLEMLFMMYMSKDSRILGDVFLIQKKLSYTIELTDWQAVADRFIWEGQFATSESVKKRRTRADTARENGQLGGRPKKPNNPEKKPNDKTQNITQKTHVLEEKENRIELEPNTKPFKKGVGMVKGDNSKPPTPTPQPLWAVGLRDGSVLQDVWGKYGEFLRGKIAGMNRARMEAAMFNFWPYEIRHPGEKKLIAQTPDKILRGALEELADVLIQVGTDGPGKAVLQNFDSLAEFLKLSTELYADD